MRHANALWTVLAMPLLGAAIVQRPDATTGMSLQYLLARNDSRVAGIVRTSPDSARATLTRLLALAARASSTESSQHIRSARQLGVAFAAVWKDSLLARQVRKFEAWPLQSRLIKATVDSLRVAGGEALSNAGTSSALRSWRESVRLARVIGDSVGEAAALGNIGVAHYRNGDVDSAETYLQRSRLVATRTGDRRTSLNAMGTLATIAAARGHFERARTLYLQSLALRGGIGDDRGAASDENNIGLVLQALGDTAGARRYYNAALTRNRAASRSSIASDNLVNLANLSVLEGEYASADALYREALSIRTTNGEQPRRAAVLHNMGLLALRRGEFTDAQRMLAEAVTIYDVTGPLDGAVVARTELAQAEGASGNLGAALEHLDAAASGAARNSRDDLAAEVALVHGDLAVEFNALDDAQLHYRKAQQLFARSGNAYAEADALQGLGIILLERNDARGARVLFEQSVVIREATGDRHAAAQAQILLGVADIALGEHERAARHLSRARTQLSRLQDRVGVATATGALASLESHRGNHERAGALYSRALNILGNGATAALTADLRASRAGVMVARGALEEASRELRAVIALHESTAIGIRGSSRRSAFRANKWGAYEQLALIEHGQGRLAEAFEVSERMRAREMLELLAGGRVSVRSDALQPLVEREQDLRTRRDAIEHAIVRASGSDRLRGLTFRTNVEGSSPDVLSATQASYQRVLAGLHAADAKYASLLRPAIATVPIVAARLAPDEAFLEYLVTDSTTLLFVVRANGVKSFDLRLPRRTLADAVDFTRATISGAISGTSQEPWRPPLERLHRLLIDPAERSGALLGVRTLLIAPHMELHYLPFAALLATRATQRHLIERYSIAYVPSASLWMQLGNRRERATRVNVLALSPRPRALPASRNEVTSIRAQYGSAATVLSGHNASEQAFRRSASSADIIHLATFGVLNKHNPIYSYIELAADAVDDGRLSVHEIFGLSLRARLVVLSACETAVASGVTSDVPAGDDWVGLVRAFLFAGADNVLGTLWPVFDKSSAAVMHDFYAAVNGASFPDALALAQRKAIAATETRAPMHWAAYSMVGAAR